MIWVSDSDSAGLFLSLRECEICFSSSINQWVKLNLVTKIAGLLKLPFACYTNQMWYVTYVFAQDRPFWSCYYQWIDSEQFYHLHHLHNRCLNQNHALRPFHCCDWSILSRHKYLTYLPIQKLFHWICILLIIHTHKGRQLLADCITTNNNILIATTLYGHTQYFPKDLHS